MLIVSEYRRQIHQFICSSTPAAFLMAWALLILALAAFGAVFCFIGAPAMNGRPWDVPILLDVAWRITNGQVPHRDFYSSVGDLPFYVTWLGMRLSRPCVSAITYGNVILMVVLGVSSLAVLRRRTSALYALAMSLFLALLAVAPRPLGDPYDYTDYAMLYNRYGEAFLGLFGAVLFIPAIAAPPRPWAVLAETAFTGCLLTILAFCKLNYFVMGLGFFLLACLLGRLSLGRALLCLLSAAAVFAIILMITHIPAAALCRDELVMMVGQSHANMGMLRLHSLVVHGIESVLYLPVLGILIWEMASKQGRRRPSPELLWRPLILMASLYAGALLLIASDCQLSEMPLLALAGLYGAEMIRRDTAATDQDSFLPAARNLGALFLFALLLVPTFNTDCKTVIFATRDALKPKWVSTPTLQSTQLSDFRFGTNSTRFEEMRGYMDGLDEGLQLLRRHQEPGMRLTAFLFSDPYHLALGLPPAEGGVVGFGGTTFDKQNHSPLKTLLGNATHILVDNSSSALMKDLYCSEWDALHLEVVEQTSNLTLLKVPEDARKKL